MTSPSGAAVSAPASQDKERDRRQKGPGGEVSVRKRLVQTVKLVKVKFLFCGERLISAETQ